MKIRNLVILVLFIAIAAAVVQSYLKRKPSPRNVEVTSESDRAAPAPAPAGAPAAAGPKTGPKAEAAFAGITISDAAGTNLAALDPGTPAKVILPATGATLTGEDKDGGKRKYKAQDGSVAFQIKDKDEGFKLRDAGDKLLWKVKFGDAGKIKVSDNEENDHPVAIRPSPGSRTDYAVEDGDTKLGEVRFDAAAGEARVNDAGGTLKYRAKSRHPSAGFALYLCARIPREQAAILALELMKRGR